MQVILKDTELRALLDLHMVSDPWPVTDPKGHPNSNDEVTTFLERASKAAGFSGWVDAFHNAPRKVVT